MGMVFGYSYISIHKDGGSRQFNYWYTIQSCTLLLGLYSRFFMKSDHVWKETHLVELCYERNHCCLSLKMLILVVLSLHVEIGCTQSPC